MDTKKNSLWCAEAQVGAVAVVAQTSRLRKSHRPSRLVSVGATSGNRDGRRDCGSRDGRPTTLLALPRLHSSHHFLAAASFANFRNCSAVAVSRSLIHAAPTTNGSGAGEMGISFKRDPAVQVSDCDTTATPTPASTAAIKLLTLSCSSTMRGLTLMAANTAAKCS